MLASEQPHHSFQHSYFKVIIKYMQPYIVQIYLCSCRLNPYEITVNLYHDKTIIICKVRLIKWLCTYICTVINKNFSLKCICIPFLIKTILWISWLNDAIQNTLLGLTCSPLVKWKSGCVGNIHSPAFNAFDCSKHAFKERRVEREFKPTF